MHVSFVIECYTLENDKSLMDLYFNDLHANVFIHLGASSVGITTFIADGAQDRSTSCLCDSIIHVQMSYFSDKIKAFPFGL